MGCGASTLPAEPADDAKGSEAVLQSAPIQETDVLIVGGGFSGCWFADKLKREHPHLRVLMVEASRRIGGRLHSCDNDGADSTVKDELGGMRIFPSHMPKVAGLLERFGLDLAPLDLGDATNLFNTEGETVRKQDGHMPLGGEWEGKNPTAMSAAAVKAYKATHFWEDCSHEAFNCSELRSLSLAEFFVKYAKASCQEIACWLAYSGYNLYHEDVQSSIYVHDGEFYGSDMSHHHFVKQGYMELVTRLKAASGVETRIATKVTEIRKEGSTIIATLSSGQQVAAHTNVILAMTAKELQKIGGWDCIVAPARVSAIQSCKPIPLFKCFMDFKVPWWQKHGFMHGKSTSDTDVRQIHYYDNEDLLIYVSDGDGRNDGGDYASRWGAKFAADRGSALREMFDIIKKVHVAVGVPESDIIEPNWDDCVHKYWEAGSHKWKKGADITECIRAITDGSSDGSQIYIAGDAFCDMQGWVEGAINTAELAYQKAFPSVADKRKAFPWEPIWKNGEYSMHAMPGCGSRENISAIRSLAERADSIMVRSCDDHNYSVQTKPDAWPLLCLRQGKAFSKPLDGGDATKERIAEAWEGTADVLEVLPIVSHCLRRCVLHSICGTAV